MTKKTPWWQTALLAAFAIALAFGAYSVEQVGNHLQYIIAPPQQLAQTDPEVEVKPNQPIADWAESLADVAEEWDTTMRAWTLGGVVEQTAVSSDNGGFAQGRVTLLGENGLELQPEYLLYGRLFFPEELEDGDPVALLDEQLALAIFRIADPVDRRITISGTEYRVIGVIRHTKQVGDYTDYGAVIPLMSVIDQPMQLDALVVEADPLPGVGASVSFSAVCSMWQNGGTVIDLGKQSMAATLWLRVLLFLIGATATLRLVGWLNVRVRYYGKRYRQQLQVRYAAQLLPELVGVILLFALGYACAAALAAALMNDIIEPVYTFPEWIPAVLVEWADIADAFWKVWQTSATVQELRTPELLRLRYFTLLIQGCAAASGVLLALRYARHRSAAESARESLAALRREGVAVSVLRTEKPIAFAEMGYVPCEETAAWAIRQEKRRRRKESTPMMRIINVQRVLQQLPPTAKDGSFVLEVTDELVPANNVRFRITCKDGITTMEEVERDWDLQLPVQTLTRIVYGSQTFHDFLENNAGYDLKMRSPAMDGLFDQHLPLTRQAL